MWATAGALGLGRAEVYALTLRELVARHEGWLLAQWDQTAALACEIRNVAILLANAFGKKRIPFAELTDLHPYRQTKRKGLIITPENFQDLKLIAAAAAKR